MQSLGKVLRRWWHGTMWQHDPSSQNLQASQKREVFMWFHVLLVKHRLWLVLTFCASFLVVIFCIDQQMPMQASQKERNVLQSPRALKPSVTQQSWSPDVSFFFLVDWHMGHQIRFKKSLNIGRFGCRLGWLQWLIRLRLLSSEEFRWKDMRIAAHSNCMKLKQNLNIQPILCWIWWIQWNVHVNDDIGCCCSTASYSNYGS